MSVNKAILTGNLTKAPELNETPNGSPFCRFSLATSKKRKNKSGQAEESVQYHNIVVWGTMARNCAQYLSKGSSCFIEGEIETRSWEDNGQKKFITEIKANTVQFLGAKSEAN